MMPRSSSRADRRASIVAAEILFLAGALQARGRERFEADEQAAQARARGELDRVVAQDRIHRRGALEHAAHAAHAGEQLAREAAVAEQVIVEEIQVPSRQPRNLGQRIVDALRVERSPAFEERVLVAERAVVRAAARHDDRVRHEIALRAGSGRAGSAGCPRASAVSIGSGASACRPRGRAGIAGTCPRRGRGRSCRRAAPLPRAGR